jgi:hypothetical protein
LLLLLTTTNIGGLNLPRLPFSSKYFTTGGTSFFVKHNFGNLAVGSEVHNFPILLRVGITVLCVPHLAFTGQAKPTQLRIPITSRTTIVTN